MPNKAVVGHKVDVFRLMAIATVTVLARHDENSIGLKAALSIVVLSALHHHRSGIQRANLRIQRLATPEEVFELSKHVNLLTHKIHYICTKLSRIFEL